MKHTTLSKGNISKQLIFLTLPLLIGNIIQQLYNTINMVIVGKFLGDNSFTSIGLSGSIMNLFTYILFGLCIGFSIIYANIYGSGDYKRLRNSIYLTLCIGTAITLIMSVCGLVFNRQLLNVINTPDELFAECSSYLMCIYIGLIFCFLYNMFSALLRSIGQTAVTLYALILAAICNIILAYTLVGVFGLGVLGAGIATIISQAVSAIYCIVYFYKKFPELAIHKQDMIFKKGLFGMLFQFGAISALQQSSLFLGKLLIQSRVNSFGTAAITAFSAAICIESLILSFGDSGASALSVFTAQNDGMHNTERIRQGTSKALKLMLTTILVLDIFLFILIDPLLSLLISSTNIEALSLASQYLKIMCVFYVICFVVNTYQGYFRGIGKITIALDVTIVQIVIRVVMSYMLPASLNLSAIAIATGCGWIVTVFIQALLIRQTYNLASSNA